VKTWIIDTGPLVAYLDGGDDAHGDVEACLSGFTGRLATTGAVITEAMHFVSGSKDGPEVLAEFAVASGVVIYDLCQPPEVSAAARLMKKYADTPMDFADATIVLLAEALGVQEIVTLDNRGFRAFRDRRNRPFDLVLGRGG
jgi:predicted nucleic acid-binding protein